ncbi:hypothetical protein MRX96_049748 [Rhipicephalus microplus]
MGPSFSILPFLTYFKRFASKGLHVAPFAEQPEQQRNTATATRRAPTGTAMPNMASRQQRIAGSRWRFTEAATSSTVEATLCSPATVQATQHQDMGGPFQPCELAVSHAITSTPLCLLDAGLLHGYWCAAPATRCAARTRAV